MRILNRQHFEVSSPCSHRPGQNESNVKRRPENKAARSAFLVVIALSAFGCSKQSADSQKPAPPAKVENSVKEDDLTTITLSPEAEARLGISTAPVEYANVTQTRTFGGEVVLPPDSAVTVSAPIAGTVLAPASGRLPAAGITVSKGQPLLRLLPFLPPERDLRTQLEKDLADAQIRFASAKEKLVRAEQLLRDKAGSVKAVEQAQEEVALAESALKAAKERMERVLRSPLDAETALTVISPEDGMVQKVHVGTRQKVAASTPLIEIASLSPIWVRVPVYVGDLASIDGRQSARVHALGASPGSSSVSARPIVAPPSASPNAATADLYFELPASAAVRPGQKVGVTLRLLAGEESLAVPYAAVIHDVHGGEWVYENISPQHYVRRRVEVLRVTDSLAVLGRGPAQGAKVVVSGAAELFGTEFGAGK